MTSLMEWGGRYRGCGGSGDQSSYPRPLALFGSAVGGAAPWLGPTARAKVPLMAGDRICVWAVAVVVVGALALSSSASASASGIQGFVSDPIDQPPVLSGQSRPDIESVEAYYDGDTGSLAMTVRFYQPMDETQAGRHLELSVGSWFHGYCGSDLTLDTEINAATYGGAATLKRRDYDGALPVDRTISTDRKRMTLVAEGPGLAGLPPQCFDGYTYRPDPYGHCSFQCRSISYRYAEDTLDTPAFLGGFDPPECDDGIDNDGDLYTDYYDDPECSDYADDREGFDLPPLTAKRAVGVARDGLYRFRPWRRGVYRYIIKNGIRCSRRVSPNKFRCDVDFRTYSNSRWHGYLWVWTAAETGDRAIGPGQHAVVGHFSGRLRRIGTSQTVTLLG